MIEKITDEELDLMECLAYPLSSAEVIFSNLEDLSFEWEEDKLGLVRMAQYYMMSYEHTIDDDPNLSYKENFKLRENTGNIDCFGGRNFGKTHFIETIDMLLACIWLEGIEAGFTSTDAIKIRGVMEEKLIPVLIKHPFYTMLLPDTASKGITRNPHYKIQFRNGFKIISINMNVASKSPGQNFFGKHLKRLYIEEASFETEEVYGKRIDARSEIGCVTRSAGMTNFTMYMPAGKRFYDERNRPWVCNLPQYCNPNFGEKEKLEAIKKHGGEHSITYRLFVKGEIVEDAIAVFDMERVKKCYDEEKEIKHFEITKSNFAFFETKIVVDRPKGIDEVHIYADIGETAPTEIGVFFKKENLYKYAYNITVYGLTDKEQPLIFRYLAMKLGASVIGIDTTDGTGRSIYRTLNEFYPLENLVYCSFSEKVSVDFERDERGSLVIGSDNKPKMKEEFVSEWSVQYLKQLFYDMQVSLPMDYKLITQLTSCVSTTSGSRIVYSVDGTEDHLLSMFRVFAIGVWQKHFKKINPLGTKRFFKGGC